MRVEARRSLVYDTGALVAADRRDDRLWRRHKASLLAENGPIVPVVVLAQAWRGGPQPNLSRFLKGCQVLPDDEATGRAAGAACAAAGMTDVVDAVVVVTALRLNAVVMTSDPDDLGQIATALDTKLTMITV